MRCLHSFHERWTRSRLLSVAAGALVTVASMAASSDASVVTFGVGANEFQMEFVKIGSPGNATDTFYSDGCLCEIGYYRAGAVAYIYNIGKFEVSEDMITKFNASQALEITKDTRGSNKPATGVSWNEAARFVNWLNTSTGNQAAYKFTLTDVNDEIDVWAPGDAGYDASNIYRNSLAKYFLPSYDELYKAAYYNPSNSTYYNFPNGSDTPPTAVASGTAANTAVYNQTVSQGPADVNLAGGLSPYGVMGLGGNVWEWAESSAWFYNEPYNLYRRIHGGDWQDEGRMLSSSYRFNEISFQEFPWMGFRVASLSSSAPPAVPEPSMMVIGTLFGLGGLVAKWRMKK